MKVLCEIFSFVRTKQKATELLPQALYTKLLLPSLSFFVFFQFSTPTFSRKEKKRDLFETAILHFHFHRQREVNQSKDKHKTGCGVNDGRSKQSNRPNLHTHILSDIQLERIIFQNASEEFDRSKYYIYFQEVIRLEILQFSQTH